MCGWLGGHNKNFSAGAADGGEEGLQRFEIGHAEGAPVAAEVLDGGDLTLVWVCREGNRGNREEIFRRRSGHTDYPEERIISEGYFVLFDRIRRFSGSHDYILGHGAAVLLLSWFKVTSVFALL